MATNPTADLILSGGKIVCLDEGGRIAESMAVADGRISAVGSREEIERHAMPETRRIALNGRTAVPGLIDGHAHMDREGLKERLPSLAGAESIDDILQRIEVLAGAAKPGEWIVTMPIGEPPDYVGVPENLREGRVPNRWELDRVAPDNPVYIRAIWGHWRNTLPLVSIANSAALNAAGIDRDTVPPAPSIHIDKDPSSAEPTGIFVEETYKPLVEHTLMASIPRFDLNDRIEGLAKSMQVYNSYGTTSVFEGHGIAAEVLAAYQALRAQRRPSVRAHLMFSPAWPSTGPTDVAELLRSWGRWLAGRGLGDDYLRVGGLYTESDYSDENLLRTRTAPYTGWAGFNYDACLPEATMVEMMTEAARNGIRVGSFSPNILDLYGQVDRRAPIGDQRWIIEHIGVFAAEEIARIRNLGLVLTAYTNKYIYQDGTALKRKLGDDNANRIAPLRSLIDAGVHVSLSTDNVPPTMFHPIWHSVARIAEQSGEVIAPSQKLTREEALAGASREGAYLTYEENDKGTLEPGKIADIAVLSADPLSVDDEALPHIVADMTIVGGEIVYDRAGEVFR